MSNIFSDEFIVSSIQTMFQKKLKDVLTSIAEKYSIDQEQLFDSYLDPSLETDGKNKKKKTKKKDETTSVCLARKADGVQCTRHKKDNSDYCGKHSISLKFGRIDDLDVEEDDPRVAIDKEKFIMTWNESIDGQNYLVDSNNVVYSLDHKIIGKKNASGHLISLAELL
jgi:hypothetical protein